MKTLAPTAADSAAIIKALDGGAVIGVRALIRQAVPGSAENIDELTRLTVAVKRHIEHGTVQLKPRGQSVQIALTRKGKRRAKLMRPARQGLPYGGLAMYGALAAAAVAVAGCSTPVPERPRAQLMGFPTPVGVQQVRGADGQGYFEPCNPCAAPTAKTPVLGGYRTMDVEEPPKAEPERTLVVGALQAPTPKRLVAQASQPATQTLPAAGAPAPLPAKAADKPAPAAADVRKAAVFFAYAQSKLTDDGRKAVAEFAARAKGAEVIYVRGSTDSQGDATANEILAKNRAAVVRAELIAHGIARARIKTTYCTKCYVDKNDTEEGRRANRRVDLSVDPLPLK